MSGITLCPICKSDCDITEEDLIDADCGACGNAAILGSFSICRRAVPLSASACLV